MAERIRNPDGWYSDDGGMTFKHPCPDASVPVGPAPGTVIGMTIASGVANVADASGRPGFGYYGESTVGPAVPYVAPKIRITESPIEPHLHALRAHHQELIEQQSVAKIASDKLQQQITELRAEVGRYRLLYEAASEKLEKIKAHL